MEGTVELGFFERCKVRACALTHSGLYTAVLQSCIAGWINPARSATLLVVIAEEVRHLSVKMQLEKQISPQTASVQWDCHSHSPDKWMLTVINLTWTVDDLERLVRVFISDSRMFCCRSCSCITCILQIYWHVLPRDATLARCMLSSCVRLSVCPSVRQSVTSRHCTKTAKHRITQTMPHDSQGF